MIAFKFTIYFWILFITTLIAVAIFILSWNRRTSPYNKYFAFMMLGVAIWALASSLEAGSVTLSLKILFSKFEHLGAEITAVFFMIFAFIYTGHKQWLKRPFIILICSISFSFLLMTLTNELHHLVWLGFSPSPLKHNLIVYHHGPVFFAEIFYIYTQVAIGSTIIIFSTIRASYIERSQSVLIIIAAIFPLLGSVLYLSNANPFPGLNLIPTCLLVTGIIFSFLLLRFKFLDLIPIARDRVIEKMSDGMVVIDSQQRVVDINSSALLQIGSSNNKVCGKLLSDLMPVFKEVLRDLPQQETFCEFKFNINSAERYFAARFSPLFDATHQHQGTLVLWHDIDEKKKAEIERENLIKELEEINATKNRFFSIISHDLRSPFTTITSFIRLLEKKVDTMSREDIAKLNVQLSQSTEKTLKLLENLLEWSRSQTGTLQFSPTKLRLILLAHSVCELYQAQAKNKDISIKMEVPDHLYIFADRHMTLTVLQNIISNGIKFSHRGGVITITANEFNDKISLHIKDNGTGMEEETVSKLFRIDSRVRKEGTENEKGSGLGLILSSEFMTKQNGSISVNSSLGNGSEFILYFPIIG